MFCDDENWRQFDLVCSPPFILGWPKIEKSQNHFSEWAAIMHYYGIKQKVPDANAQYFSCLNGPSRLILSRGMG